MDSTIPGPRTQPTSAASVAGDHAARFFAEFTLPDDLEAPGPAEAFGVSRDSVRLEVASSHSGIVHSSFREIASFLRSGDVLVVNDSATLPAALTGRCRGREMRIHVSTPVPGTSRRLVEIRLPNGASSRPSRDAQQGDVFSTPAGGRVELLEPRYGEGYEPRLWEAELTLPDSLESYLQRWGQPIRYSYVKEPWPLHHYQTVFAQRPGSSEMPSAGRPFTLELLDRLACRGIEICTITLHTGVASLESHEPPYPEPYSVSEKSASVINTARELGGRVIAVGTTVVRALETAADADGLVHASRGFTELVITPDRGVASVDGLVTGWHEPQATHLMMLEAIAGRELLAASYAAALDRRYLWHEFGDSHLILP